VNLKGNENPRDLFGFFSETKNLQRIRDFFRLKHEKDIFEINEYEWFQLSYVHIMMREI
jgi:hypothetical protein